MTVETYITFGVKYGRDPERSELHPLGMTGHGYAVIEAPDRDAARAIAHAAFDRNWAFDYSTRPERQFAQEGELLRLAWIPKSVRDEAIEAIRCTFEAAEGDSNDTEGRIEVLQEARDLLMRIIGYTREETEDEGPEPSVLHEEMNRQMLDDAYFEPPYSEGEM